MKTLALNDKLIGETLSDYGVSPSGALCQSIRKYVDLLIRWNQKIALTTVVDPAEILRFHFGESMFGVNAVPIRYGRLADVGTGAGFPAIPISMLVPELRCVLIESNHKKATFVSEIVRTLNLEGIQVFRGRMEDYSVSPEKFDFTVSRALGIHEEFLTWSALHLNPDGQVVFWIGDDDSTRISSNPAWNWRTPVRIPHSQRRALLIGSHDTRNTRL